jgi:SAM-dependent methyltransferase
MSKLHSAQEYWNARSDLFASYYQKPSLFDKVFRKGVYFRTAVGLNTVKEYNEPTILDVGSGPGVNSVTWLKNSNAKSLLGIDFAESMVEFARKLTQQEGVGERAKYVQGDFITYPFEQKFDIAIACGVFDYIKDAEAFLKRMASVSNKAFVASWPENGLRMALRRYRYTCPVYHYTEQEIRRLHDATGVKEYEVIKGPAGWVTVARWSRT